MKKCLFLLCVLAASVSCVENLNDNNDETIAELSLTETEVEFEDAEEASLKVLFVATHAWSAEVIKGDRWLSVETSSGDGSKYRQSVKISVSENTAKKSREGKIVFMMEGADDQTLVVTQAGAEDSSDDDENDTSDGKEDDDDSNDEGDPLSPSLSFERKIKSMHIHWADGLFNRDWEFEYDSKGRLVTMTDQEASYKRVYNYSYSGNQLKVRTSDSRGTISFLFEGNKAVSSEDAYSYEAYHYTSEGQLEKIVEGSYEYYYLWAKGNIVQKPRGEYVCTYEYSSYENKANLDFYMDVWTMVPINVMLDRTMFADFSSRCLLSSCTLGSESYSFTYDFDSRGYVKKFYCYEGSTLRYDQTIVYDDENNTNDDDNIAGDQTVRKRVKSVVADCDGWECKYDFFYDADGNLVKFSYTDDEPYVETAEIEYSGNVWKWSSVDSDSEFWVSAYYKNDDGLWYYSDWGEIVYENGHIVKHGTQTYEWSANNIVRHECQDRYVLYEYLNVEDKLNVDVLLSFGFPDHRDSFPIDKIVCSDFFSKHLPVKETGFRSGSDELWWITTFKYAFDSDGYVTSVEYLTEYPNSDWSQSKDIMTIEYEK